MRLFIAVELPKPVEAEIARFQGELSALAPRGVSWVKPENIHCTVKFLGEIDNGLLPALQKTLSGLRVPPAFGIRAAGTGVFPRWADPRVIWVGLDPLPRALAALHEYLETALEPLGFPPEERRFSPHLTLGRVRDTHSISRALDRLRERKDIVLGEWTATEFVLFQSVLKPSGAEYTILQRVPLGGPTP
ncbi:MAG: RNA 2',3'-cyclic phosphodiesterase [Acidobacteria bacterium]|nr:RNA 2',3'-cyclic phosphodiesterase [Acidobacteriota bacterium]